MRERKQRVERYRLLETSLAIVRLSGVHRWA